MITPHHAVASTFPGKFALVDDEHTTNTLRYIQRGSPWTPHRKSFAFGQDSACLFCGRPHSNRLHVFWECLEPQAPRQRLYDLPKHQGLDLRLLPPPSSPYKASRRFLKYNFMQVFWSQGADAGPPSMGYSRPRQFDVFLYIFTRDTPREPYHHTDMQVINSY